MIPIFGYLPCVYKNLFGISCPACGAQRAAVLLAHGEVWESIKMFPPWPVLLLTLLWAAVAKISGHKVMSKPSAILLWTDLALMILNCVYQNIFH